MTNSEMEEAIHRYVFDELRSNPVFGNLLLEPPCVIGGAKYTCETVDFEETIEQK